MEDHPIFIAGPDRSGTTLLYALLASHPNISMVRRMNYWRWFYGRYGDLKNPQNFERLLNRLENYKRIKKLNPDWERIRQEFWQGEPTYTRLFSILMRTNAEKIGKPRWGEKSLHTELFTDLVFSQYPQAKVIHMSRDPRDRYASVRKRFGKDSPRIVSATARLLKSMQAAFRNKKKYPQQYLLLRYEDLATKPEETLRKVCAYIGEEYTSEMLSMGGEQEFRDSGGNSSFNKIEPGTISTKSIGRYRDVLTPYELQFIQQTCGKILKEFDYPFEKVKLTLSQNIKYYGWMLPMLSLRMTAYNIVSWIFLQRKNLAPATRFIDEGQKAN
jgi:hypothetical protein